MASRRTEKERRRQERLARERAETRRKGRERRMKLAGRSALVLIAVGAIVVAIATGGSGSSTSGSAQKLTKAELAALPDNLAQHYRQANQIIDTPIDEKLAQLRGIPVVVNQWASWCPSCVAEFGFFQDLARQLRGRVAFLGLDSQDDRGDAEEFLERFPVNYPSIYDRSASQAVSIGAGQGWPTTVYFNRRGERTFVRQGGYTTAETLRADIERYALGNQG
jgi:cytochrome c biogenesis protein CcmG/thiol:disulfide interchange protein DsbE